MAGEQDQGGGGTDFDIPEDDGLTPEEQRQFEQMRVETSGVGHAVDPGPQDAGPDADAAAAAAAAGARQPGEGAEEDDDGEDGGDAGGQAAGEKKPPRRVRWARFAEKEQEAKTLRDQLTESQQMLARFEERMAIVNQALQPKVQEEEEDDDPEPERDANGMPTDIYAHHAWLQRQLGKTGDRIKGLEQNFAQQRESQEVQQFYEGDALRFAQVEPNFGPAYMHMVRGRAAELAVYRFGISDLGKLTPQQQGAIQREVAKEEQGLVRRALQQQMSPAKLIYELALARGYQPRQIEQRQAAGGDGKPAADKGNGAAPGSLVDQAAAVASGGAKPNGKGGGVTEEVRRIKEGSESGLSLSQGGGAPARTLTAQMLATMPEEEFNAIVEGLSESETRRLFGGGMP